MAGQKAGYPELSEITEAVDNGTSSKRKPGLLVRMDPELLAEFQAACEDDGRTAAATVRTLIKRYLRTRTPSDD